MKLFNIELQNISRKYSFKYLIKEYSILMLILIFAQCSEEINKPFGSGGVAPSMVTDIEVTPLAGGAKISYKIPSDKDLSYVEATVRTPEGKTFQFKSSSYSTDITILGLATVNPQEVEIRTVNKNEIKSEPYKMTVTPLQPPYLEIFESLRIAESFGAVRLNFRNKHLADIGYFLGYIDGDKFVDYDSFYSKSASEADTVYFFRGLEAETKKFALYIRDRWDNYSDTIYAELTPLLEKEISKTGFDILKLENDGPFRTEWNEVPENLIDGFWGKGFEDPAWYMEDSPGAYRAFLFNNGAIVDPMSVTVDMGNHYYLNRIVVQHYWRYTGHAARKWEVWGSKETPPFNGDWEWSGWIKLADMEHLRPSKPEAGEPYSEEDKLSWVQGTSADVIIGEPIRYIRIRSIESWDGKTNFSAAELRLFGKDVQ